MPLGLQELARSGTHVRVRQETVGGVDARPLVVRLETAHDEVGQQRLLVKDRDHEEGVRTQTICIATINAISPAVSTIITTAATASRVTDRCSAGSTGGGVTSWSLS